MNYTSTRYDGPYGPNGHSGGPTHSASSSTSSYDGGNMAGVGSHAAGGSSNGSYGNQSSNGSYGNAMQFQHHHHNYDSSGDYAPLGSSGGRMQAGNSGPSMRTMVMQQQQQQQQQQQSQLAYASHHRQAQPSDDYDSGLQYASYNSGYPGSSRVGTPTSYSATTPRADRDPRDLPDGDNAFDFLLSPGLAPVGPISTSSSFGNLPPPLAPPPSQPPPALPNNNGLFSPATTPSRPVFNRSQTAMPAPSTSGRAFQAPSGYAAQQQAPMYTNQGPSSGLSSSNGPVPNAGPSGQASTSALQSGREYTPPPAITAKALLDIVLNMRADQPGTSQGPAPSSSSASMSRSQSANATARLQQGAQVPAHMRNISTGSNRSDDDGGMTASQLSSGLNPPHPPGMARTASSRNVNDSAQANLRTIDLTHHRIAEVPVEVIDALEGTVGRLALGYNYIATLPPSFAKLGNTLRYLNIRLNMLTVFPAVLCEMPSLEILDISRNKIKRLPAQCGTLKGLRVFSISKNRVKRLPTYFADMKQLRVLKIDHNPLEWPPREITTQPTISSQPVEGQNKREAEALQAKQEAQALQKWLTTLQDWVREHAAEMAGTTAAGRYDDLDSSAASRGRPEPSHSQSDPNILRGARDLRDNASALPGTPPSMTDAFSPHPSPKQEIGQTVAKSPKDLPAIETDASRLSQHGRSESHSLAQQAASRKGGLQSKKSLPDLRQNHAQILDDRLNNIEEQSSRERAPSDRPKPRGPGRHFKTPSNASSAGLSPVTARPSEGLPTPPRSAGVDRRDESSSRSHARTGSEEGDTLAPLPSPDVSLSRGRRVINGKPNNGPHQNNAERGTSGAYFKRLSMLPPSTISKAVPPSLLQFIEGIRGIFFALSQIHASLKNCVVSPAMDRLPAVFTKVIASADDAMGFLIDALDKFDSTTRRGAPEKTVVKDVIETCRENLTIFNKLVTIVLNQTKALFSPTSDIRYIRTLVLGLYGGMGEIAMSWEALGSLHGDILAWLRGDTTLSPTSLQLQPPTPSPQDETFTPGPLAQSSRPSSPMALRSPKVTAAGLPQSSNRTPLAKARRHAGSFSKYNPQLPS